MIINIQLLRFIAALLIVVHHSVGTGRAYGFNAPIFSSFVDLSKIGVDIFFVISGFVITLSFLREKPSASVFLMKRFCKVIPMYWIMTTILLLVLIVFPSRYVNSDMASFNEIALSYLFLSQLVENDAPIFFVGWTLEFEMLFYSIFGIFIFSLKKTIPVLIFTYLFTLILSFFVSAYMMYFAFGIVFAIVYMLRRKRFFNEFCIILVGVFLPLVLLNYNSGEFNEEIFLLMLAVVMLCFFMIFSSQLKYKAIIFLGRITYSTYLGQVFSISLFYKGAAILGLSSSGDLLLIGSCVFTVFTGALIFMYIEVPVDKFIRSNLATNW